MKSEFLLAFNQVCAERNLPREVVLDAIRTALVSAYRRDVGAPATQNIESEIDLETGKARVYVERQVVEHVTDPQVEISLHEARRLSPQAQLGDMVMVENTPPDFGRIAAQTARQVVLQRIREAEREAQYAHYVEQEGELVYGTVQSVTPQQVTLHLERTEAILPRKEMVPGERYVLHDRIRAYVIEVRRTARGPQIIVSRSHKKMLQQLLELEVPEIANGTVEIKSIAREAGSRSKVAVVAKQEGVDPVGACVGMRGMRIQSIVKELGGEKIDIVEWSPDPITFIAKALGPARVLSVMLEDDPVEGKTANVVVPDDQLSLAIGKAGQNARLAAKLTNWRIDIQGVTEAAEWALAQINAIPELLPAIGNAAELLPTVVAALRHYKEERLPYNAEELVAMRRVIEATRSYFIARRGAQHGRLTMEEAARRQALDEARQAREEAIRQARALIPPAAYAIPLSEIGLSPRVLSHLENGGLRTVADVMERLAEGEVGLLQLEGIGAKSMAEIREALERLALPPAETLVKAEEIAAEELFVPEAVAVPEAEAPVVALEEPAEAVVEVAAAEEELVEAEPMALELGVPLVIEPEVTAQPAMAEEALVGEEEGEWMLYALPDEEEEEEEEREPWDGKGRRPKGKSRRRHLVFDEKLGRTVPVRKHRRGRVLEEEPDWEDL
jgi:N utilization substance protein A